MVGAGCHTLVPGCDYAEGRLGKPDAPGDMRRLLAALRARRPGLPVLLILTARTVTGGWVEELRNELQDQRQFAVETRIPLPNKHPDSGDLYKQTVRDPQPGRRHGPVTSGWTVMDDAGLHLARVAGRQYGSRTDLPARKADLYESALAHEASTG